MNILQWIDENWELICICLGLLFNLVGLIYNLRRARRCGAMTDATDWLAILEAARQYEKEAEGFADYSGAEKLQYVLSRLRVFTAELGCRFDEEAIIGRIEADIDFSKAINGKETDRPD